MANPAAREWWSMEISEDRRTVSVCLFEGTRRVFSSHLVRPEREVPFTDAEAEDARRAVLKVYAERKAAGTLDNTSSTGRRYRLGRGWWVYTYVNTGPPTWWWPRLKFRGGLGGGWYRIAVRVKIKRGSRG